MDGLRLSDDRLSMRWQCFDGFGPGWRSGARPPIRVIEEDIFVIEGFGDEVKWPKFACLDAKGMLP